VPRELPRWPLEPLKPSLKAAMQADKYIGYGNAIVSHLLDHRTSECMFRRGKEKKVVEILELFMPQKRVGTSPRS